MNLPREQIKAYKNMIKYLQEQIEKLERKHKINSNMSKDSNGKIFNECCCMGKPKSRIYLKLVNKHKGS